MDFITGQKLVFESSGFSLDVTFGMSAYISDNKLNLITREWVIKEILGIFTFYSENNFISQKIFQVIFKPDEMILKTIIIFGLVKRFYKSLDLRFDFFLVLIGSSFVLTDQMELE